MLRCSFRILRELLNLARLAAHRARGKAIRRNTARIKAWTKRATQLLVSAPLGVKARESRDFGDGAESVNWFKRRTMVHLAIEYVTRHRLIDEPCRFDVVAIHLEAGQPVIEIYQNAFDIA